MSKALVFLPYKDCPGQAEEIAVTDLTWERAQVLTCQLSLALRYESTDSHLLLMVLLDTDRGQSMHSHSAERGDTRALRRGANELVNRLWKAYQVAVEQAEA
jgi:hypothetical protein